MVKKKEGRSFEARTNERKIGTYTKNLKKKGEAGPGFHSPTGRGKV